MKLKTLFLLLLLTVVSACGSKNSSGSVRKKPLVQSDDKGRTGNTTGPLRRIPAHGIYWYFMNGTGNSIYLKCYDKNRPIKDIKVVISGNGMTMIPTTLNYEFIPRNLMGITLDRWPAIDRLGKKFKDAKRDIKEYCNGKSYFYMEDFLRGLDKGRYTINVKMVFLDNTYLLDKQKFRIQE